MYEQLKPYYEKAGPPPPPPAPVDQVPGARRKPTDILGLKSRKQQPQNQSGQSRLPLRVEVENYLAEVFNMSGDDGLCDCLSYWQVS